jgi:hypothetical protein
VDKATAAAISRSLEHAIARLTETLAVAERQLPAGEFAEFKGHVGLAIGRISHDLLDPIYPAYPDLAPPGVL